MPLPNGSSILPLRVLSNGHRSASLPPLGRNLNVLLVEPDKVDYPLSICVRRDHLSLELVARPYLPLAISCARHALTERDHAPVPGRSIPQNAKLSETIVDAERNHARRREEQRKEQRDARERADYGFRPNQGRVR